MIINLKRTFIRIIIIIIIIFIVCKLGIFIRENNKLLKFYSYRSKKLKKDKMSELNDINNINKQILINEKKYIDYEDDLKYNLKSYKKVLKNCSNQKIKFIHKFHNLANDVNENINNKFDILNTTISGGKSNDCAFPEFEDYKDDNKCCPKSFSNNKPFSNNKRCSTDIITDRSFENLGNPIENCKKAKGYVSKISSNYICTSYLKSLRGGNGFIELGSWRIGYTKHTNNENNNTFFTICNTIQEKTLFIIDNNLVVHNDLIINQDALYVLPLEDEVTNIQVGDGYIQFSDKWRFGCYDDDNFLISPIENYSYCWSSNGDRKNVKYSLWNKEDISKNIYFDGKQDVIRFGKYWYVGQYDNTHFSICNKLTNITSITYIATDYKQDNDFEVVIESKDCNIILDKKERYINNLFKKSNLFKYETDDETIFYHRISIIPSTLSIYNLMINSFNNKNNILNKDFKLYNTFTDYKNSKNSWNVCEYDIYTEKDFDNTIEGHTNLIYYGVEQIPCKKDEFIDTLEPGEGFYYNKLDGSNYPNRTDKLPNGKSVPGPYKRDGMCRKITLDNSKKIKEKVNNFKKNEWVGLDKEEHSTIGYGQTFLAKPDKNIGFPANCGIDSKILNRWARNTDSGKSCSSAKNFKFSIFKSSNIENNTLKGPHKKYSINNINVFEEFDNIDALSPQLEEINLQDIDKELKIEVNNNCPFKELKNNCPMGTICTTQKCCPTGFNNTEHNANYKQCGSETINDILKMNCNLSNGYIKENIIEYDNPNFLNKQKKIVYNCVNKSIDDKNKNIIQYILLFILVIGTIYIYTKIN